MRRYSPFHRRALAGAAALALLLPAALPTLAQGEVLAPGTPPLTREMTTRAGAFYGWLLDVELTQEQLQAIQDDLVDSWRAKNAGDIDATLQVLKLQADLAKLPEGEAALVRETLQADVLADLRKTPNEPGARWVLGVYDSAHRPIAAGDPPLTRQASDANAELVLFMASVALDGTSLVLDRAADRAFKDGWAASLGAEYDSGAIEPEQQQQMARMPLYWAALRVAWPQLPAETQATYRALWAEQLQPEQPADAESEVADVELPVASVPPAVSSGGHSAAYLAAMKLLNHRAGFNQMMSYVGSGYDSKYSIPCVSTSVGPSC